VTFSADALLYGGLALVVLGGGAAIYLSLRGKDSSLWRAWTSYTGSLERDVRFLLLRVSGSQIAQAQLVGIAGLLLVGALLDAPTLMWLGIPAAVVLPRVLLRKSVRERREKIEHQLAGWLLMLANMLKATGSLGDAIRATAELTRPPIGEEIDLVLKEVQLGTPLDQALTNMAKRVDSRTVSTMLATLLVGRNTGGDLPRVLEDSAATLREMERLEGLVRTQTAQGKAQLLVLAVAPAAIFLLFRMIEPKFFDPLFSNALGIMLVGIAVALWAGSLALAKRILDVDL